MKASTRSKIALAVAVVAGLSAGIAIAWLTRGEIPVSGGEQEAVAEAVAGVGDRRPDFMHAGVGGELWRASDFDGRPTLVNFWATWCAPCVREMPLLQGLADRYPDQLNVVGIAIDEPGKVGEFVERLDIDYPILIGTSDVRETQAHFGNPNGMLPYSVLIDAQGIVRWRHLGELDEDTLEDTVQPFLEP
ncbi:MAG TPA: TlpA disulfide reductase family protein [Wenzhouxiangellaceae bacterium]|nr:TlpA disulfide reductase family protein [Wenzhouxiangellaceae bacterium]